MKNYKLVVDGEIKYEGTDRIAFLDAIELMVSGDNYEAFITPVVPSVHFTGTVS